MWSSYQAHILGKVGSTPTSRHHFENITDDSIEQYRATVLVTRRKFNIALKVERKPSRIFNCTVL